MKNVGIILAAGSSTRMGGTTKKQYRVLLGHPVLFYSLMAFEQSYVNDIIIVCSEGEEDFVNEQIVEKYGIRKVRSVIAGAKERSGSSFIGVKEAIRLVGSFGVNVLIHDAARPLVTPLLINNIISELEGGQRAVVPAVTPADTIRFEGDEGVVTFEREKVRLIQTPQGFEAGLIRDSYEHLKGIVTDDAEAVMKYDGSVTIKFTEGDRRNFKLTYPTDFELAEYMVKSASGSN
ncbi:MAG: 2-C-methyl-D-erythritol 4-phosphate cytidylyltransferase [Lachnospiraceae bacterium]|nr:2-C-methyl-D-erythritol 4-phosphate cytidylyltransferase [Lachnospiraceae bacterium]